MMSSKFLSFLQPLLITSLVFPHYAAHKTDHVRIKEIETSQLSKMIFEGTLVCMKT